MGQMLLLSLFLVYRFHKGEATPVVTEVSKFMETLLNDCSGEIPDGSSDFPPDPHETVFLVLRVLITNLSVIYYILLHFWFLC